MYPSKVLGIHNYCDMTVSSYFILLAKGKQGDDWKQTPVQA